MPIIIRTATMEDIPAIRLLIPESVRALSKDYYSSRQIESALLHIFGIDTQLIRDETYFVAEVEGQTVGCGGWSKRRTLFGGDQSKAERNDPLLNPATDAARIRAFFVHPAWARRGIGRQIIERCEDAAQRAGFTQLELAATFPGEPFYAALGYTLGERFEALTPDGEPLPLFRMVKRLR